MQMRGSRFAVRGGGSASHAGALSSERRDEFVAAARSLYQEKGLKSTSIQDIADRVGVARSLFYHYFRNKDDVTSAVLDTYVDDFVEAVHYWDEERVPGDIEGALDGIVRLFRMALFENDAFRLAIASSGDAALYLEFVSRVADRIATHMEEHTAREYLRHHEIRIDHVHETLFILLCGMVGYLRRCPNADNELLKDLVAQTLHIDRRAGGATSL